MRDRVVLDSSVAVKWFVDEPDIKPARRIREDFRAGTLDLLTPDLIYAEIGSIVWKKHLFQGLPAPDAQAILATFLTYPLDVTSSSSLLDDAYRLAVTYRRSVYDSLYLALSLRVGCRFVTADERLVNAVGAALPNVVWLPNWT